MIPVTLALEPTARPKRTFRFERGQRSDVHAADDLRGASRTRSASYERQYGTSTFYVRGTAKVKEHEAIAFDNLFARRTAVDRTRRRYIVAPLAALLGNDYEKVDIEGIELTIGSTEEPKTATLERVWLDDQRPRAGRTVPFKVLMRTQRGEELLRTRADRDSLERHRHAVGAWWPMAIALDPDRAAGGALAAAAQRATR